MPKKKRVEFPEDLYYLNKEVWLREVETDRYALGITDYLQNELGDVVGIVTSPPETIIQENEEMLFLESIQTDYSIRAPTSLIIKRVNDEVTRNPELINEDPYENWIIEVSFIGADVKDLVVELEDLLDEVYELTGYQDDMFEEDDFDGAPLFDNNGKTGFDDYESDYGIYEDEW